MINLPKTWKKSFTKSEERVESKNTYSTFRPHKSIERAETKISPDYKFKKTKTLKNIEFAPRDYKDWWGRLAKFYRSQYKLVTMMKEKQREIKQKRYSGMYQKASAEAKNERSVKQLKNIRFLSQKQNIAIPKESNNISEAGLKLFKKQLLNKVEEDNNQSLHGYVGAVSMKQLDKFLKNQQKAERKKNKSISEANSEEGEGEGEGEGDDENNENNHIQEMYKELKRKETSRDIVQRIKSNGMLKAQIALHKSHMLSWKSIPDKIHRGPYR